VVGDFQVRCGVGGWLISRDASDGIRDDRLSIIGVFGRSWLGLGDVYFLGNVGLQGRWKYLFLLGGMLGR